MSEWASDLVLGAWWRGDLVRKWACAGAGWWAVFGEANDCYLERYDDEPLDENYTESFCGVYGGGGDGNGGRGEVGEGVYFGWAIEYAGAGDRFEFGRNEGREAWDAGDDAEGSREGGDAEGVG